MVFGARGSLSRTGKREDEGGLSYNDRSGLWAGAHQHRQGNTKKKLVLTRDVWSLGQRLNITDKGR